MRIAEFEYSLALENIAAEPREVRLGKRDRCRMLVVDRSGATVQDSWVQELPSYFDPGDVLVLNNSGRIPGVLKGRAENGGQVDLRFAALKSTTCASCRIYPDHAVKIGSTISVAGNAAFKVVVGPYGLNGIYDVEPVTEDIPYWLQTYGTPIPSFFSTTDWPIGSYNPYYTSVQESVGSPMAGLHFTPELMQAVKSRGVEVVFITLHVAASWLPFLADNIDDHQINEERFTVTEETAQAVNRAKAEGRRVVACGSTVLRTLETAAESRGRLRPMEGISKLYIRPGYEFKIMDRYFTNFHVWRSSLMVLDSAVCGFPFVRDVYAHGASKGYLFQDFGDAVFYV
jgi:S-adenosylmethionine:tRNA ribosyltransferase-isomerase